MIYFLESGENATLATTSVCPVNASPIYFPVDESQILNVSSELPLTILYF